MKQEIKRLPFLQIVDEIHRLSADTLLFVVDKKLPQLYPDFFIALKTGVQRRIFHFVEGEDREKNFARLEAGLEVFLSQHIHRNCHLIAIGGGSVTDLGGLIASLLLRGISWSAIPTTILGMVDASIGGKTSINSKHGKNLIGTFHLPENIWIDEGFIKTLPLADVLSGYGEVIKYAFIDPVFGLDLEKRSLSEVLLQSAEIKRKIVESDFKENGERKLLNFGHTFGHGIEKLTGLPHGQSVYWGMEFILKYCRQEEARGRLKALAGHFGLGILISPWRSISHGKLLDYVRGDKKVTGNNHIDLIVLNDLSQLAIVSEGFEQLENRSKEVLKELTDDEAKG